MFNWLEQLFRDAQYGLRNLARTPGFTATAVISLAMGIMATTAIYMPKRTVAAFLCGAIDHGLPPHTPAVAVYNATRRDQHVQFGTVATLAEAVGVSSVAGPAIVLIGRVISDSLRDAEVQSAIAR